MKRAENKVVIVTGGALGIGRETCILLAKEKAKVAVTDILDREGEELVAEIKKSGGIAKYWHLDVSDEQEVKKVYAEVVEEFGKLDATVNNAGIAGVDKPTHELTEDEWDSVMSINVKGVFFCTKHAIPHMQKSGGGSIINLSSIYGIIGAGDIPHYHASKGAVRLMAKNDALIYAKDKIRVNSVHPGFIWTPLVEEFGKDVPDFRENLNKFHPIGHVGEPMDIAYGILYLVSDESKFVTGSELVIDGGYTCK
ncbi:SDR family NAD(P)-dependent oxidoreductase [Salegentibacter salarius]|uniref:Short-chain dehydrogenase n=1 Tax=Salegentibacter salarius TaxID=435906 RepID=A0A2N0U4X1_9FLAO|nr:glucose 1-dehydrogenase [Salegentibacter salarius]OEY73847.1 short-chain dehydrogenase [Salegentibacter salarius]PKD22049.1 short-chain dehydrogenase [Salegentibacter salarius]SLJ86589.1 NAD(P)-dependent dehydrogenase, short-chain alcohol dehydrogenase family [Salegentibacter salarius]